jgi:hypothetical protein
VRTDRFTKGETAKNIQNLVREEETLTDRNTFLRDPVCKLPYVKELLDSTYIQIE